MGVPKFFKYISERYPCLCELVKDYQIPEFDNLYLDMNGIIHNCSHPDDGDPFFRMSYEKMFASIFHYLEILFSMIRPKKLFFLAIDGVAPRAKMNQQRGRRFRTARDADLLEMKAKAKGEVLPLDKRFDSNCITPGTVFMTKLNEQLKYFITKKISNDKKWQHCKIILSGHETPGEGEHKIMDYIRYLRSQPGYDPNTRHCLYGLDADLIMLGLCTHEPHFSLLREEVKFGKKAKKMTSVDETIFFLLHLSLMREYLEMEFIDLKETITFEYNIENIIDDWVLMGFLVGNDFIPHLPNLHIHNDALPLLCETYKKVLPKFDGYINEGGRLNLPRFRKFLEALASVDHEAFEESCGLMKYFESKTGRPMNNFEKSELKTLEPFTDFDTADSDSKPINPDLARLVQQTDDLFISSSGSESEEDLRDAEFTQHKADYYRNKMEYEKVTSDVLKSQANGYIRAIQWNLHYYYEGISSWSWFYPHHYAPYISDIMNFELTDIDFELGKPFLPFEQLLAVLPAASKELLPEPYQELMTSPNSPIITYYPQNFETDLNGKRNDWEAVVLIPFIEEEKLLAAMKSCESRLTLAEKNRNKHGPMLVFEHTDEDLGLYSCPKYFNDIVHNHAKIYLLRAEDIRVPRNKLIKGAYPGAEVDIYFPGFPTFKHLNYSSSLKTANVKVFEQPSRKDNMIVKIEPEDPPPAIEKLAEYILGQVVHVSWPHLEEAKVISVSNEKYRYTLTLPDSEEIFKKEDNVDNLQVMWQSSRKAMISYNFNRLGIDVGDTDILIHAATLTGRKYIHTQSGKFTVSKQWATELTTFAYQAIIQDLDVHEPKYDQYKDVKDIYSPNSICFMLGFPHYGSPATVLNSSDSLLSDRIKIMLTVSPEPDLRDIKEKEHEFSIHYLTGYIAAQHLGINSHLLSRITGSIFVIPGPKVSPVPQVVNRINIGLNLKFNKRNEEIPGYTRKEGSVWLYSTKAVQLVRDFMNYCPEIFEYLSYNIGNDVFFENEIFPDSEDQEKLKDVADWIKKQPYTSIERQGQGSQLLDPDVVKAIETRIDEYKETVEANTKKITMEVLPKLLFKPELQSGNLPPDPNAKFFLYDRVINTRESHTVPLGLKGTIIGIHEKRLSDDKNSKPDILYDILFDESFENGMTLNCSEERGYRLQATALINITYGIQIENNMRISKVKNEKGKTNLPNENVWKGPHNSAFVSWRQRNQTQHTNYNSTINNVLNLPTKTSTAISGMYSGNDKLNPELPSSAFVSCVRRNPARDGKNSQSNTKSSKTNEMPSTSSNNSKQMNFKAFLNEFPMGNAGNAMKMGQAKPQPQIKILTKKNDTPKDSTVNAVNYQQKSTASNPPNNCAVNQILSSLPKQNYVVPQNPSDSTEVLKQLLRITTEETDNKKSNHPQLTPKLTPSVTSNPIVNSHPISVQDLFAQAKMPPTIQLLSMFQRHGLGIPRYNYIVGPNLMTRAQITLPDRRNIVGAPASTREQASEFVAAQVLKEIANSNLNPMKHAQIQYTIPPPPQQWCQKNMYNHQNQRKFYNQSYSPSAPKQQPPQKSNNVNPVNLVQNEKSKSVAQQTSPFVPLQAVKPKRFRINAKKEVNTNENNTTPTQTSSVQNSDTTVKKQTVVPEQSKNEEENKTSKPQITQKKIRKSRIAANFNNAN